jgi:uncharacterized delta-60 repeat protein
MKNMLNSILPLKPMREAGNSRWFSILASAALIASSTLALSTLAMAQAGQLDSTFATGGIFETHDTQSFDTAANAVALQSDGKIVVGGELTSAAGVLRLNTNGTLDSGFGAGGLVVIHLPGGDSGGNEQTIGVAVQSDGKIVAGISNALADDNGRFILARLNTNGSTDTTFGNNGFAIAQPVLSGSDSVLAQQRDGKILLAGNGFMVRFDSDGQIDTAFGQNGAAQLTTRFATGIALQANGGILITSGGITPGDNFPPGGVRFPSQAGYVARYTANGVLDTSFGISGEAATVAADSAIALQSGGKIVIAGAASNGLLPGFALESYSSSGAINSAFGKHGGVNTSFTGIDPTPNALAIQANGDIVAAGGAGTTFALARYSSAGTLDTTFGTGGRVTTAFGNDTASIVALAIQPDGKIVAVGDFTSGGPQGAICNIAVARYLAQ